MLEIPKGSAIPQQPLQVCAADDFSRMRHKVVKNLQRHTAQPDRSAVLAEFSGSLIERERAELNQGT